MPPPSSMMLMEGPSHSSYPLILPRTHSISGAKSTNVRVSSEFTNNLHFLGEGRIPIAKSESHCRKVAVTAGCCFVRSNAPSFRCSGVSAAVTVSSM